MGQGRKVVTPSFRTPPVAHQCPQGEAQTPDLGLRGLEGGGLCPPVLLPLLATSLLRPARLSPVPEHHTPVPNTVFPCVFV